ncbi:alpha/beta fold hydrolase [Allonocardiopsis opalescens]|uniref:Pimeloyl-ACP methyl ester carboxylesterase n=1 Tax=Allonocardiopsis opalescens TaxID=1144618 RepID=A0A2T0PVB8_9ACTN|nr:alpha/beta fold hydrolase [Allonocardiopsis opalescens]PRX95471.1 pimeloyl-ACP methyl ester carboxylesterase [Allonocardiopsis opalescens]
MGLPIVFVHGIRLSGTMWRPQIEALEARGHRAVALDMPGHGSLLDEVFSADAAVELIARSIDELGGRALLVGLSMGGYLGIAAAAAHPDRVAGLVAASCTVRLRRSMTLPYRWATSALQRLPDHGEAVSRRLMALTLAREASEALHAGGIATAASPVAARELADLDPIGSLRQYLGPVWLVNGARDTFRLDEQRFLNACFDGRLLVVRRAGHLVNLNQPERFTSIVTQAAEEVDRIYA